MVYFDTIPYLTPEIYATLEYHFTKNIYRDTLRLDTLGYVVVKDTVFRNDLVGRSYGYNIKHHKTEVTKTVPVPPKGTFYLGASVWGNRTNIIDGSSASILYKNKKDRILGINAGVFGNKMFYGVSSYWKID